MEAHTVAHPIPPLVVQSNGGHYFPLWQQLHGLTLEAESMSPRVASDLPQPQAVSRSRQSSFDRSPSSWGSDIQRAFCLAYHEMHHLECPRPTRRKETRHHRTISLGVGS